MRRGGIVLVLLLLGGCLDEPVARTPEDLAAPDLASTDLAAGPDLLGCVSGFGLSTPLTDDGGTPSVLVTGTGVALTNLPGSGELDSTIFATPLPLTTIAWQPTGIYGRALPDNRMHDPPGDLDGVGMSSNVLLYHFDETAPPFHDTSSLMHDATCSGTCGTAPGRFRRAASFDGTQTMAASGGNLTSLELGAFTIEAWAYPNGPLVAGDTTMMIVDKGWNTGPPFTSYSLEWEPSTGHVICYIGTMTSPPMRHVSNHTVSAFDWFHAACTYDGSQVNVYVNGRLSSSTAASGAIDYGLADNRFFVGRYGPSQRMVGLVDEAAVFDTALPAGEITNHYLRGALTLRMRVRGCALSDCSDGAAFTGPDSSTFFEEGCAPTDTGGVRAMPLGGFCGGTIGPAWTSRPYTQFRVFLGSMDNAAGPVVGNVTLCP
jgi:Concanavalin A-like lectin/glucanases superfamily